MSKLPHNEALRHAILSYALLQCVSNSNGWKHDNGYGDIAANKVDITWRGSVLIPLALCEEAYTKKDWNSLVPYTDKVIKLWNETSKGLTIVCRLTPSLDKILPNDIIKLYLVGAYKK